MVDRSSSLIWIRALLALFLLGNIPVWIGYVDANVFTIGFFRLVIAVITSFLFLKNKALLKNAIRKHWRFFLLLGFCFFIHWLTYFTSIKVASASVGILGLSSYGIHLLLMSSLLQKEKLYWFHWLSVGISILGAIVVIPEFSWEHKVFDGMLLGVVSGFFYACIPILHQRRKYLENDIRMAGQFMVAGLFFLLCFPMIEVRLRPIDWGVLIALGVVGTFVAHSLWIGVTTKMPAKWSSSLYYLAIPIAIFMVFLIHQEVLTHAKLLGGSLILGGNLIAIWFTKKTNEPTK
jgi:drug/metabolite transporter (DMT)-like permease